MKSMKYFAYILAIVVVSACDQEVIVLQAPEPPPADTSCEDAVAGSASFTKFVAIGNSYVAGFQAGALFNEGQANSLPAILNKQFQCAGAPAAFVQPNINTALGFNIFITPNPTGTGVVLGRLLLQGASPKPTPQVSNTGAIPNPAVNPGFIYTGGKANLNNFGVQAIVLGQALIPETGAWAGAGVDPRFNPFYGRLAYPGTGTSTIIGDAAAAGGSFFLFWLGLDDFFLHAAFGGDPTKAPLTTSGAFQAQYGIAIGALLGSNPNLKGVVANFPSIFVMPHFTSVTWNPIPLDATTAGGLTASLANNYNAFLDNMVLMAVITAEEATLRKISYGAKANNPILISDETLTDLSAYMVGPAAGLLPYARARQTKSTDILPLSAGSIIGTTIGGDPTKVYGVSVPLADQYVLIPSESSAIEAARVAFNATVKAVADANPTRLAHADINKAMADFITAKLYVLNGVSLTPNINPPTGIYSEDGVHPNSRGYAFLSRVFIEAINAKFASTIPLTDVSKYQATALPIP